ncbi:hypothetical protein [Candidatus Enterovibrio altilux]|uniref:hypothetical protein n=1 Tax=Candidatus Enterovibrio altilux TaxID=1927128 RepID=UPI0012382EF9|nr:hypothetical protein [Candidatus Enterovibrio luxaltus]
MSIIIGLSLLAFITSGMLVSLEYPELKGFNFCGSFSISIELTALMLALVIYIASFITEIVHFGIDAVNYG